MSLNQKEKYASKALLTFGEREIEMPLFWRSQFQRASRHFLWKVWTFKLLEAREYTSEMTFKACNSQFMPVSLKKAQLRQKKT